MKKMAVSGRKIKRKISSKLCLGSEESKQLFCQPCDRNGPQRPAFGYCKDCMEHLCQSCFNNHKNVKPCRNHRLLEKDAMPNILRPSSSMFYTRQTEKLTKPCQKHKRKSIEFYCNDHKTVLCSVCVALEHPPGSCPVSYIPEIARETANGEEYEETVKNIDDLLNQCQKVKTETKNITEKSNSSMSDALKSLKKYRQQINKMFDDMEKEMIKKAQDLQQENNTILNTINTLCEDMHKSMKDLSETLNQLNTAKEEEKLFVELKYAQNVLEQNENCINDLCKEEIKDCYDFEPNKALVNCLEKENSLGILLMKSSNLSTSKPTIKLQQAIIPTAQQLLTEDKINVSTSEDEARCFITGTTCLTSDQLILVDSSNKCIKMVDVNKKQIVSQLSLSSKPWDITTVSKTELAVTLPDKKEIQLILVTSDKFTLTGRIQVDGECHGIGYYQHKLVVTLISPDKLQILDMQGNVLTTVSKSSSGESILKWPIYVTVNNESIYVSSGSSVVMVNWKGEVTGIFKDMNLTTGLALTKKGSLYACDRGRDLILEISNNCKSGHVVLNKLIGPKAICWSDDRNTLYSSSSSDGNFNIVKVYKMS